MAVVYHLLRWNATTKNFIFAQKIKKIELTITLFYNHSFQIEKYPLKTVLAEFLYWSILPHHGKSKLMAEIHQALQSKFFILRESKTTMAEF